MHGSAVDFMDGLDSSNVCRVAGRANGIGGVRIGIGSAGTALASGKSLLTLFHSSPLKL